MSACSLCGVRLAGPLPVCNDALCPHQRRGGRPGGPAAALDRLQSRELLDGSHSKDTDMDARVRTSIVVAADTDIKVNLRDGHSWVEFGDNATLYGEPDQLRRLNVSLTEALREPVLARTIESDQAEDR